MSPSLGAEILSWAYDDEKPVYKATLKAVADARKVRSVFLQRQPRTDRHLSMLDTLARPRMELAASTLLRTWLLKGKQQLLVDFLNALGIEHEDGVVDDLPESMEDAKVKEAIDAILETYPQEVVAVYLNAFNGINETNWPSLNAMLETDDRLQLGTTA